MTLSCEGKKVPKVIKSLNKALGLSKTSKVVWDILSIEGIENKVEYYHPNTTSTTTITTTVTTTTTVKTTTTAVKTTTTACKRKTLSRVSGTRRTEGPPPPQILWLN